MSYLHLVTSQSSNGQGVDENKLNDWNNGLID